jgi:iron complex transport system ATP-binding protein
VLQQCGKGLQNTALEMVLSGNYPAHTGWYWESTADRQKAQDALEDVGLADKADITLAALSGGELRRAEIARLLVQNPTLAMLDEPLNHLDIGQQLSVLQLLQQRFQRTGHALLMVLHDLNLARQLATHCLLLFGDGRWQAGTTQAIADVTTLSELMGYPLLEYDTPYGKRLSVDYPK